MKLLAAKPSVLMLGQYSTGKTTFIRHLLGREYPGANIGPEPTTDRFTVVMHGYEERRIPGNTLAVSPDQPYQSLHHFGAGFLGRLEGATCNTPLLESISIVDTPGVLSGEKQRIERAYSFIQVRSWLCAVMVRYASALSTSEQARVHLHSHSAAVAFHFYIISGDLRRSKQITATSSCASVAVRCACAWNSARGHFTMGASWELSYQWYHTSKEAAMAAGRLAPRARHRACRCRHVHGSADNRGIRMPRSLSSRRNKNHFSM